jgi:hypothetical protein
LDTLVVDTKDAQPLYEEVRTGKFHVEANNMAQA